MISQTDGVEKFIDAGVDCRSSPTAVPATEMGHYLYLLASSESGEQIRLLENDTDSFPPQCRGIRPR